MQAIFLNQRFPECPPNYASILGADVWLFGRGEQVVLFGPPGFPIQFGTHPYESFPKLGIPYFGVLIMRILLFRVLYSGPLFRYSPILESRGSYLATAIMKMCLRKWSGDGEGLREKVFRRLRCRARVPFFTHPGCRFADVDDDDDDDDEDDDENAADFDTKHPSRP